MTTPSEPVQEVTELPRETVVHALTDQGAATLLTPEYDDGTYFVMSGDEQPDRVDVLFTSAPAQGSPPVLEVTLQLTWPDGSQTREDWDLVFVRHGTRLRIGDDS